MELSSSSSSSYGWAQLIGFGVDRPMRVRVTESRDGYVWVVTADLASAGVPLTLNANQVEPDDEW